MLRSNTDALEEESHDPECDELGISKHEVVEPVVFKGGPMTSAQRNKIYSSHSLPGIGKKVVLTAEQEEQRKVCAGVMKLYF